MSVETLIPLWLVMSALPALMYAITNHLDKHLLEKHFVGNLGVNALVVISAFVSVVAVPVIWFLSDVSLIPDDPRYLGVFALVGLLHTALIWFYLTALQKEDTTTIVVFYALLPILGLIASNLFLGETLLPGQLVALAVIISGILVITFEISEDFKYRFKFRAALLMLLASLCWALGDVVFKIAAIEENIWRSLFWEHIVLFLVGLIAFFFLPNVKEQITTVLKVNKGKIISINLTSELLYIGANVISAFPLIMVQVAAVHLVQAFQPVWVFLIGLVLWKFGIQGEKMTKIQIVQKGVATVIAVFGMYLLALFTPT